MPIPHYAFRLLSLSDQLAAIWAESTLLMTRWEEEDAINLYWMSGRFFAEVYYNEAAAQLHRVRTFTSAACLADYTCYVQLPPLG